jgi:glycosyltransferase involved in cell wall biosynthesis
VAGCPVGALFNTLDTSVDKALGSPFVSIIVATLDARSCIEACIESMRAQSIDDWELLVADGCSTDGTLEVLQRHSSRIAWWESRADRGIYDAWNRALPHCRGHYVMFLGADDRLAGPDVLARLKSAMGSGDPDLLTSHGMLVRHGSPVGDRIGKAYDWSAIGRRMVVCHPGLLHARRLFEKHGRFDPALRIVGDFEFLLRLPKETSSLHVDLVSVLVGDGGVSRRQVLARLREQRVVLSHHPRFGPAQAWWIWLDRLWRLPVSRLMGVAY